MTAKRSVQCLTLVFSIAVLLGCSSAQKIKEHNLPETKVSGPVTLRLGAKKGSREVSRYRTHSVSESFEEGAIRLRQEQGVEFVTTTETLKADNDKILQVVTTIKKDGDIDLHSMAKPELGERLEVGITRDGRILLAGPYPKQSLFFVPEVSLPEGPVSVGDTWEMQADWVTLEESVPFTMDMISILKGFVKCGNETCADIETSGEVRLQGMMPVGFKNEWRGRLLFAMDSGTTVWSYLDSREDYAAEAVQRTVNTCAESKLEEPQALVVETNPVCNTKVSP